MTRARLALFLLFAAAAAAFFAFGGHRLLSLDNLRSLQAEAQAYYAANPMRAGLLFFGPTWRSPGSRCRVPR